jgi:O-antigen/teichoic acid export membrane protein
MSETLSVMPQRDRSEGAPLRLRHVPNAISAMVLFSARLLMAVVQLRYVDRYWGGAFTGLNALSNQVLLYVTLLELGLSQSAITLLYEPILKRDHSHVSGLIAALRHDVRLLAAGGALVIFPALWIYAHFIRGVIPFLTVAFTLSCIATTGLLQLSAIQFQAYLNAAERLDRVNYTFSAGFLLKTSIGLPLAIHFHQYLWLPGTIALLTVAEVIALRVAFHREFPHFRATSWRRQAAQLRNRAKYVLIQRVAGVAFYQSDFVILSITTSLASVRDYAKFQYVAAALLSAVGLIAAALTTTIARLQIRQQAEERRRRYVSAQFSICFIGAVLMLAFWFTSRTVVGLAFGTDPAVAGSVVVLFGIALFLNMVKTVDDVFLMAKGRFEVGYWIPAIEVPCYVAGGVLLSHRLGFAGILLASIGTNLFVSVVLKGIVLARPIFDSSTSQWYAARFGNMFKALLLAAPVALAYSLAAHFLHPSLLRFGATNLFALAYIFTGLRLMLPRKLWRPVSAI